MGVVKDLFTKRCAVCDKLKHPKLLRRWNEQDVCLPCIEDVMAEIPDGKDDRK